MKKFLGLFLFLILACGLSCGTARAQQVLPFQLPFSDLTDTGVSFNYDPTIPFGDAGLPAIISPPSTNEQRTVTWAVTTPDIVVGHSVIIELLEPNSTTAVSDYLIITQNATQLQMSFQSDGDTGSLTVPTVANSTTTTMTEDGTAQLAFSFSIPVTVDPESDVCDGNTSCSLQFQVTMESDVGDPTPPPSGVPEPATMMLLGFGLVGLTGARRFKK